MLPGRNLLTQLTYGDNVLDFFYNASGNPYVMRQGYASSSNYTDYYYITNLQGDVIRLVDIHGNGAAYYEYDPYGNVLEASDSHANINPLRYRGYVYDSETGLYYLQSRYYDPKVSRYLNPDVLFDYNVGIRGYNLFAYCGNSPVFRLDPNGRASIGAEEDGDPTNDTVSEKEGGGTGVNPGNTNITSTSFGNGTSADTTISTSQAPGQAAANSTHIQLTAAGTNRVKSHTTYNQYGLPAQRIDYIGRAHGGIKTPHVHTYSYIVRGDNVYRDGHDIRPYVSVK